MYLEGCFNDINSFEGSWQSEHTFPKNSNNLKQNHRGFLVVAIPNFVFVSIYPNVTCSIEFFSDSNYLLIPFRLNNISLIAVYLSKKGIVLQAIKFLFNVFIVFLHFFSRDTIV